MRSLITLCAAVTLSLACCAPRLASAQGSPAPEAPLALTPQNIPQVLSGMGYEPVRESSGQYHVVIDRGGYTIFVRVALSSNRSEVWLTAKLGKVDTDHLPAEIYRDLLRRDTDTAHFNLCDCADCKGSVRDLCITQPFPNRSLTRAYLRQELDGFCNTLVRLASTWEPALNARSTASAKPSVSGKPFVSTNRFVTPKPLFSPKPLFNTKPYTIPNPSTNPRPFVAPKSFTSILNGR